MAGSNTYIYIYIMPRTPMVLGNPIYVTSHLTVQMMFEKKQSKWSMTTLDIDMNLHYKVQLIMQHGRVQVNFSEWTC